MRNRIVTTYFPIVSASAGGAYSQQIETLAILRYQNDPIIQIWVDINKEISTWIYQGEQIILVGDWNSEALEVITWM